jgi:type I restriction enzyme S subunit
LRIRPNPRSINPRFLFDTLGSPETSGTIANRAKGATMLNLNSSVLKSVPVLVAPRHLQDVYADQVEPMAHMVELLSEQNQGLRTARDLLLPRLMSGEIPL